MDLNKKILKQGIISIIAIVILLLGFACFIKLDKPVFLKHYSEYRLVADDDYNNKIDFHLKYISNSYDKRRIRKIEFMDGKDIIFDFPVYNDYVKSEDYGLYRLNTVYTPIDLNNYRENFDSLELNNARITFYNNGTTEADHEYTIDVDLGRIILNKEDRDEDHFQMSSGGGSRERFHHKLRVKKDLSLIKLEFPIFDGVDDLYDLKIDGKDYKDISGLEYKAEDMMDIAGQFKKPSNILNKYSQFNLRPRLYFKDSKGQEFNESIVDIRNENQEYSFLEIIRYLRTRGEI